jgi:pyruvate dehydrogenase E1 component
MRFFSNPVVSFSSNLSHSQYLHHREIKQTDRRTVWAYLGDGEMDEPESLGAISVAGREKLDNLIFE